MKTIEYFFQEYLVLVIFWIIVAILSYLFMKYVNFKKKPKAVSEETDLSDTIKAVEEKQKELEQRASYEENDFKAESLAHKSRREKRYLDVLTSNLIQRLEFSLQYEITWSEKNGSFRIENYDNSGKVAVFYPKSDKLNFKGKWYTQARDILEKHLNDNQS